MAVCFPDYTVNCNTAPNIGDRHIINGFCNEAGALGTAGRIQACSNLGVSGEFGDENQTGSCGFPAFQPGQACGGIAGVQVSCRRLDYKGDITDCCVNAGKCISSNGGTCDPEARSFVGKRCQQFFLSYCSTNRPDQLEERWAPSGICTRVLDNNALAGQTVYVADLGTVLLNSYFSVNQLSAPGTPGFTDFQDRILDICQQNPNACQRYLQNNLCTRYSRSDLANGFPEQRQFCGCHLRAEQYDTFLNNQGSVSVDCDGLCSPATTVKRVDSSGRAITCNSNICVIDNVTVQLIESNVGEITFANVCGGCSGPNSSCTCLIKDVSIEGNNSTIGGINFNNECQRTNCYQTNSDGIVVEVPCGTLQEQEEAANNAPQPNNRIIIIILAVLGVIIFALFIIGILIFSFKRKKRV